MRFVAGRGAVAELLLAGALWRSCCWPGRRGGKPSGISCWPRRRGEAVAGRKPLAQRTACRGIEAELHREELAAPQKTMWLHREELAAPRKTMRLHREANKRAQKEKGPKETLISLPSHFYLLPCERATRQAQLPLQLCRDCKEGCSKCKNCVELWEYGKDKGVTEYVLSV